MNWNGRNVLITGGNGFIGGWVAKGLVEMGSNVVSIDIEKPTGSLDVLRIKDKVKVINGSVTDCNLVKKTLDGNSIDSCFHLAAQAIVGTANKSPISTFETNIKGTWTLLEAVRNSKTVEQMVVASTDKAYGDQEKLPYTEDQPLLGIYPYDASKVCTDVLSRCFARTYDLPIAVTRCANIYGGGDMYLSRIVPGTIIAVLKGERPVIRSDGTPERDYMYIKDAVSAYLTLAENLNRRKVVGEAFNFGTETPISVLDLFRKIIKLCGKDVEPIILNEAKGEIQRQFLGITKARKILGWKPKFNLDAGLKETIKWYVNFFAYRRDKGYF